MRPDISQGCALIYCATYQPAGLRPDIVRPGNSFLLRPALRASKIRKPVCDQHICPVERGLFGPFLPPLNNNFLFKLVIYTRIGFNLGVAPPFSANTREICDLTLEYEPESGLFGPIRPNILVHVFHRSVFHTPRSSACSTLHCVPHLGLRPRNASHLLTRDRWAPTGPIYPSFVPLVFDSGGARGG